MNEHEQKESKQEEAREHKRDWNKELKREAEAHDKFREEAKKALKNYEAKKDKKGKRPTFPIFRSVVGVQLGAMASKMPQARVQTPTEQQPAQAGQPMPGQSMPGMMQAPGMTPPVASQPGQLTANSDAVRAVETTVNRLLEVHNAQQQVQEAVEDYLTAGLGGLRVVYDADFVEIETKTETIHPDGTVTVEVEEGEQLEKETAYLERFPWASFGWEPAQTWQDVGYIYFHSKMPLTLFVKKYGFIPDGMDEEDEGDIDIYEIWDKERKERIIYSPGHSELLDKDSDPLGVDGFFPIAEPMFFGLAHDELTPRPEYAFWERLAERIEYLTNREETLVKAIKNVNFYEESYGASIEKARNGTDGDYIPVNLKIFGQGGGSVKNAISPLDANPAIQTLATVTQRRDDLIQKLHLMTGVADIMQQASNPNETATAQQLKNKWGHARLAVKRYTVEEHVRASVELLTRVVLSLFQPETIAKYTGVQIDPQTLDALAREIDYRVDVETKTTLSVELAGEREETIELMATLAQVYASPMPQPLKNALVESLAATMPNGSVITRVLPQLPALDEQTQQALMQAQQAAQQATLQAQQLAEQNKILQKQLLDYEQKLATWSQAEQAKDIADAYKKQAEVAKVRADAELKLAEAEKTKVETLREGAELLGDAANALNSGLDTLEPDLTDGL